MVSRAEAEEYLKFKNKLYIANDFNPMIWVEIITDDYSQFKWNSAFYTQDEDYFYVFTEHFGAHLFHKEETKMIHEYRIIPIQFWSLEERDNNENQ